MELVEVGGEWEGADPGYSLSGRKTELTWEKEQPPEEDFKDPASLVGRSGLSSGGCGRRVLWLRNICFLLE